MTVVQGFRKTAIAAWASHHLSDGSRVVSAGLACFSAVKEAGCVHQSIVTGGGGGCNYSDEIHLGEYDDRQYKKCRHRYLPFN